MVDYWYIKSGDFSEERRKRIGASDIPALIPNPEKPSESLAGYERTAVTVWQEKTGRAKRKPAGLPAEMGHRLEPIPIELFIRTFFDYKLGREYFFERQRYEMLSALMPGEHRAEDFQSTPFRHNIQYFNDVMIAHPDSVFEPGDWKGDTGVVTVEGVTVDRSKPFGLEAKSAQFFAAKRPAGSMVKGYDFDLAGWQGIPLKHYMQIQYSMALYRLDVWYLPLLHDTSRFHVWRIDANKSHQNKLIDLAGRMAYYIDHDKEPKEMVMNGADIQALYPDLGDDYRTVTGEERSKVVAVAQQYQKASEQVKRWEAAKKEAADSMAVILKDTPEIRDANQRLAKWVTVKGSEKIVALKTIKKENPVAYRYLKRKKLIEDKPGYRRVQVDAIEEE